MTRDAARGHRCRPHTADVIIEAWGPTRSVCAEEAVRALVETFAEAPGVPPTEPVPVHLDSDGDQELLVRLFEEVLYVVDVQGKLPVGVSLDDTQDGGLTGFFDTVSVEEVEVTGAIPKGVSRSNLALEKKDGCWRCRVLVDV